jgi:glucosamine-phosphate N-acetyltransferase
MFKPKITELAWDDVIVDVNGSCEFLRCLNTLSPIDKLDQATMDYIFWARNHIGVRTFVARSHNYIVGTASIFIEQKYIHGGGMLGHIEDVAVLPECQGCGIGYSLVEECLRVANEAKCYRVILDCSKEVQPFYEKLGFYSHSIGMRLELRGEK